ncbi:MAG: T9SS type A sorting domain-containing protein [Saprospiraceae bacterium]
METTSSYEWMDNSPMINDNYYRLKITGDDGEIKYSPVISVRLSDNADNRLIVFPTISDNMIHCSFEQNVAQGEITIYNIMGVVVKSIKITNKGEVDIDITDFKKGQYILQFSNAYQSESTKFIKQ